MNNPINNEYVVDEPLVPLTLRIGITGHRPNKLVGSDPELLKRQISRVLVDLQNETNILFETKDKEAELLYRDRTTSPPLIRIVSALAEGADRLVFEQANLEKDDEKFNFEFVAVLPFDREEYECDFYDSSKGDSEKLRSHSNEEFNRLLNMADIIIELNGNRDEDSRPYERVGEFTIRHSDILVAIWDPEEKDPGPGGTSDIIHKAVMEGLTVICIDAKAPHAISIRNNHDQSPRISRKEAIHYSTEILQQCLRKHLLFYDLFHEPDNDYNDDDKRRKIILDRLKDFKEEVIFNSPDIIPDYVYKGPLLFEPSNTSMLGRLYPSFVSLIAPKSAVKKQIKTWKLACPTSDSEATKLPISEHGAATFDRIFSAFLRTDQLASYYASLHRSIFMTIYICGGLALSSAAAALFFHDWIIVGAPAKYIFAIVEFALLITILFLWRIDHAKRYHDRWIEYRSIAELLRPMIHLSLLGRAYPLNKLHDQLEQVSHERLGHGGPARSWAFIYVVTVLRWAGVASIKIDADGKYLRACREFWSDNWFDDQLSYHIHNSARMHVLGSHLQRFSFYLFWGTVAMVTLKLANGFIIHNMSLDFVGLLAGILPAIGTIAFAIRNHAEFDISAKRSMTMRVQFNRWKDRLSKTIGSNSIDPLADLLDEVAEASIRESSDWGEIFEVKVSETA